MESHGFEGVGTSLPQDENLREAGLPHEPTLTQYNLNLSVCQKARFFIPRRDPDRAHNSRLHFMSAMLQYQQWRRNTSTKGKLCSVACGFGQRSSSLR